MSTTSLLVVRRKCATASYIPLVFARHIATEAVQSNPSTPPPPLPNNSNKPKPRSRLQPRPRPAHSNDPNHQVLPSLPSSFGRNQLLPVSNSTRALLESIVAEFDAPIRYAYAYGSGVFEQDGYNHATTKSFQEGGPMLDFMFAVTHPAHFHSVNMRQNPSHYTLHAKLFGSDYVSRVQALGPGVWFNAYVPMKGVTIKYGVTTLDTMCADLLNWKSLYQAGRMHKPLRIIKDDARVRLTQQVNLTSAIRLALLHLSSASNPSASFSERQLFETIASISYSGDPRMLLPAENRSKVQNIVSKQLPQFHDVYQRLASGLPGVHWSPGSSSIEIDSSPQARAAHLKKLPSNLLDGVKRRYLNQDGIPSIITDESQYWTRLAGDARLDEVLNKEIRGIVRGPATVQSLKGIVSAGLAKSLRYSGAKVGKWWSG